MQKLVKKSERAKPQRSDAPAAASEPPLPQALLSHAFFQREAPVVARALIGAILVHQSGGLQRFGRIVETEAYDEHDPASHSFRGRTQRTQVMFGPAGRAYVYRSYGLHWCINVSCAADGFGAAVLLRAIEPLGGLQQMALARSLNAALPADRLRLCRGPGNITQAFGLGPAHNGQSMRTAELGLYHGAPLRADERIEQGPRIGISVAQQTPWRYYIAGCPYVSARRGRRVIASPPA